MRVAVLLDCHGNAIALAAIREVSDEEALTALMYLEEAAWTRGVITQVGVKRLQWLKEYPLEFRRVLPDRTRVLLVHAAPGTDGGLGLHARQSCDEARAALIGADADLVFVGHTHAPMDRTVDGVRVINLGSVSNPVTDDRRTMWTLLDADDSGYRLERRFVAYDLALVIRNLAAVRHPLRSLISDFFRDRGS